MEKIDNSEGSSCACRVPKSVHTTKRVIKPVALCVCIVLLWKAEMKRKLKLPGPSSAMQYCLHGALSFLGKFHSNRVADNTCKYESG